MQRNQKNVFVLPFLVRLRDHGAWPGISQYSISHLAILSRIFYLAFLSRIFISHLAFLSRIFISHLAFLSRIFISHLAFFISHLAFFLSRISHFYLAFNSRNFFSSFISRISNVPYRLPYNCLFLKTIFRYFVTQGGGGVGWGLGLL